MLYYYKMFDCFFASDLKLSLPMFNEATKGWRDHGEIRIRLHDFGPPPPRDRNEIPSILNTYRILAQEVGVFDINQGRSVDIYPVPGVDESILEMWLLGITMSTLIYQRGYFVLHACAVRVSGVTVGLIGNIGDGKSTLTASLLARGHEFLADDLLALDLVEGAPRALTGFPLIKLSDEIATHFGFGPSQALSHHPYKGKSIYHVDIVNNEGGYRLDHLFLLDRGPLNFEKMSFKDSFVQLHRHSVPTRWGHPGDRHHFSQCSRICKSVPFTIFRRPFDIYEIGEQAKHLEDFLENGNRWTEEFESIDEFVTK